MIGLCGEWPPKSPQGEIRTRTWLRWLLAIVLAPSLVLVALLSSATMSARSALPLVSGISFNRDEDGGAGRAGAGGSPDAGTGGSPDAGTGGYADAGRAGGAAGSGGAPRG